MEIESTFKQAYDYSIRLLSKRDYSIYKLTQKLLSRKFDQEHIDSVIERLITLRYIREDEYIQSRIKQLVEKGYANDYVIQKLEQECLRSNSSDIELVRDQFGFSSSSQLENLIEKKLRSKSIPDNSEEKLKMKQRITAYLATKGYSFDEISTQLDSIMK
jgi:regulatory protein